MRSAPARTATFATLAALLVPLAACSSPHHTISTSAGAPRSRPSVTSTAAPPTVTPTGTAAGAQPSAVGTGGGGVIGGPGVAGGSASALAPGHQGSVTVADVRPVLARGTASAPVTCEASGSVYVALISKALADGYLHTFTVRVAGYEGAGRYRGTLSGTVAGPHGTVASLTEASNTAVTLTKGGGTFAVNVTGSGDHTLDATVSWVCP
jgi:hypothetical protein